MPDVNLGEIKVISSYEDSQDRAIIRLVVPDFSFGLFSNSSVSRRLTSKNGFRKAMAFAEEQKRVKRDAKLLQKRCQGDLDFFLSTSNVPDTAR